MENVETKPISADTPEVKPKHSKVKLIFVLVCFAVILGLGISPGRRVFGIDADPYIDGYVGQLSQNVTDLMSNPIFKPVSMLLNTLFNNSWGNTVNDLQNGKLPELPKLDLLQNITGMPTNDTGTASDANTSADVPRPTFGIPSTTQ